MDKPPEEGRIWEWRAFGSLTEELVKSVNRYPIRSGLQNIAGEDIYFISPTNDQNVKLRRSSTGWVLKFKILLESRPLEGIQGNFELYDESLRFTYLLPVGVQPLRDAANLLSVTLPKDLQIKAVYDREDFSAVLARANPAVVSVRVTKRRSQLAFDGGWIELADISFPGRETQSLSLHSPVLEEVTRMAEMIGAIPGLEPMNYVAACRRWKRG